MTQLEPAPEAASAQPAQDRGFRPDIQGMRALAVSMVVVYHLHPSLLPGGFAGVDVFFVISGFLITGHLLREYRKTRQDRPARLLGPPGQAADARGGPRADRHLGRLPRWCCPPPSWPTPRPRSGPARCTTRTGSSPGTRSTTSSQTARPRPVQHFWSLSVEEQFYLGWPLLFLLAALAASVTIAAAGRHAGRRTTPGPRARGHLSCLLAAAVVAGSLGYSVYYTRVNPAARLLRDDHPDLGAGPRRAAGAAARAGQPRGWAARRARLGRAGPGDRVGVRAQRHRRLPRAARPAPRGRRRAADPRRLGGRPRSGRTG